MKLHHYNAKIEWTGNLGNGTLDYTSYSRNHSISSINSQQEILASSDPSFKGDKTKYNPEELFIASIASCHMLWYLHLCSINSIIILNYIDNAKGIMNEIEDGSGKFKEVTLCPTVKVKDKSMIKKANDLHHEANKMCFIANSCNFKITHQPNINC